MFLHSRTTLFNTNDLVAKDVQMLVTGFCINFVPKMADEFTHNMKHLKILKSQHEQITRKSHDVNIWPLNNA